MVVSYESTRSHNLTGLLSKDRRQGNGVQHILFSVFMAMSTTITAFCYDLHVSFAIGLETLKKRFSFFSFTFVAQCPAHGKPLADRVSLIHSKDKHRWTFTGLNRGGDEDYMKGRNDREVVANFCGAYFFITKSGKFTVEYLGNGKKNIHWNDIRW